MKVNINNSKKSIITIVIFIFGLILLFKGINSNYKYNHALSLENLSESECKEGVYVVGNIDSYVGFKPKGSNTFTGSSHGLVTYIKTYDFYTVPIVQGSYIRIMVSDKSTLSALKNFEEGKGESLYFEGEIIASPIDLNYKWYSSIEGFRAEDVIEPYVIKEINFESNKDIIYVGILLTVFSALLFFSDGGIKSIISKDTEDIVKTSNRSNEFVNSYNKQNDLVLEIRRLELFEKRLSGLKRKCLISFVLLGIGIYIIVSAYLWELKFIGILLVAISIKSMLKYFINSNNALALHFVKLFGLESLSLKIEECKDNIDKIENC